MLHRIEFWQDREFRLHERWLYDAMAMRGPAGCSIHEFGAQPPSSQPWRTDPNAAIASVSMALFLLVLKIYAEAETGSVALLGSLADTGFDVLASLLTLFSVRYAARPADDDHRFGHGKAEALSALVQVMLVIVSAALIGWRAVDRLGSGESTAHPEMGIGVSLIAIVATLGLLAYQRSVIKKTGSVAIHGDHLHYQGDLLLNIAVIIAIALESFLHLRGADPLFGIGIALWLLCGASRAAKMALDTIARPRMAAGKTRAFFENCSTPSRNEWHP